MSKLRYVFDHDHLFPVTVPPLQGPCKMDMREPPVFKGLRQAQQETGVYGGRI